MKLTKAKKIIIAIIILITLIIGGSFIYLKQSTYSASKTALSISQKATHEKKYDLYASSGETDTALIFYPGALVKKESYSIWATELAEKGYDVYVMDFPLNLAIFSPDIAQQVIDDTKDKNIIMAGHSLGGVMASRFAAKHPDEVSGMVFLASYPDEKGSLKNLDIPTLSITADNDHVLNQESYEKAKKYLPKDLTYAVIEGGNHSGFGSYGLQKKDGKPTISNEEQQTEISIIIGDWIKTLK